MNYAQYACKLVLSDFRRFLTAISGSEQSRSHATGILPKNVIFINAHIAYFRSRSYAAAVPYGIRANNTGESFYIPFTSVWISFWIAHWRRRIRLSRRKRFKRNNIYYWKWSPLSLSLAFSLSIHKLRFVSCAYKTFSLPQDCGSDLPRIRSNKAAGVHYTQI